MHDPAYLRTLRQYRDYPLPFRTVEDDLESRYRRTGDDDYAIRNLVFAGRDVFGGPCRILVAGGGTGDSTLYFSKLLQERGSTGTVVHLDQSPKANAHCRERLERLGIKGVEIQERSLFDLDPAKDGQFDYVNCNGVLHHLHDPDAGLAKLAEMTAPDGGLGIWVYAKYGRAGLYHVQNMMLDMVGDRPVDTAAIELTKAVLEELPRSSLGHFDSAGTLAARDQEGAVDRAGEQTVDRFLNSKDRPYSAREMFQFVDRARLHFAAFQSWREAYSYEPLNFVKSPVIRAELEKMTFEDRAEFAERWHCKLSMHRFYLTKAPTVAMLAPERILKWTASAPAESLRHGATGRVMTAAGEMSMVLPDILVRLFSALDGRTATGELIGRLGITEAALLKHERVAQGIVPLRLLDTSAPIAS